MSDDTTITTDDKVTEDDKKSEEKTEDQRVPYERFQQANTKAKEAATKAADLQKQLDELKVQMDERETAGLPELERERKRAEQLEKRAAEAERKAEETEAKLLQTARKSLVTTAAGNAGFTDPSDATRFPEIVNLDDIEDADQAERAVKRLAKARPDLLKKEDTKLPGRVLDGGRTPSGDKKKSDIDLDAEAEMVSKQLSAFLERRRRAAA